MRIHHCRRVLRELVLRIVGIGRIRAVAVQGLHVVIGVAGQLANFLAAGIEGIKIEFAIAIGAEVNRVADSDGIDIIGAAGRLRNFFGLPIGKIEHPQLRMSTAAVAFPLLERWI